MFESEGFSFYNSNKFSMFIFIACLSSLWYEREDEESRDGD